MFSDVALIGFSSFDRLPKTRRRDSHAQRHETCRIVRNGVKMNCETLHFRPLSRALIAVPGDGVPPEATPRTRRFGRKIDAHRLYIRVA